MFLSLSFNLITRSHSHMASSFSHQSFTERMIDYLSDKGWPKEYNPEELNEKFLLLDWIAFNLLANRPPRTRQLFLYGGPDTQKTLFLNVVSKVLNVFATVHKELARVEVEDNWDLILVDKVDFEDWRIFPDKRSQLLTLLDGPQPHYSGRRQKNVPIILIGRSIPDFLLSESCACGEKVIPLKFFSQLENLSEERIIATLWSAFLMRASTQENLNSDSFLEYNELVAEEYFTHFHYEKIKRPYVYYDKEGFGMKVFRFSGDVDGDGPPYLSFLSSLFSAPKSILKILPSHEERSEMDPIILKRMHKDEDERPVIDLFLNMHLPKFERKRLDLLNLALIPIPIIDTPKRRKGIVEGEANLVIKRPIFRTFCSYDYDLAFWPMGFKMRGNIWSYFAKMEVYLTNPDKPGRMVFYQEKADRLFLEAFIKADREPIEETIEEGEVRLNRLLVGHYPEEDPYSDIDPPSDG